MIRVHALGQSTIEVRRASIRPDATVLFAVLLILCAERGRQVERETLGTMLWPRESVARRKHNLRQVLYKLRQLGVSTGDARASISLPRSTVWLDFEDGDPADTHETIKSSATLGPLQFMPGFPARFSKPFAEWFEALRERAQGRVRTRLVEAIRSARHHGRWADVDRIARHCLEVDPLNEEATLALAEVAALSGAKSKAMAMLDAYNAELGPGASDARLPATILRRRISERIAARPMNAPETALIGREDVMHTITAAFEEARSGRSSTHVLWGASGIGKTRVLDEMRKVAVLMGGRVFAQQAAADDQHTPGLSLVRLLGVMMDAPGILGLAPDVLALLKQLTAQAPAVKATAPLNLGDDVLVRALVDLERALAYEAPLVIVLDDLHHADVLSRRVLSRAQACLGAERVLVLGASVPEPAPSEITGAITHPVGRLSESATTKLAATLLDQAGMIVGAGTVDALAAASGGHPFVLREAIAAWRSDPDAAASSSLDATLTRRIASLSLEARDVLFTALILGELASVSRLMGSTTLLSGDVERAVVELEREQILRITSDGVVLAHSLWHGMIDALVPTGLAVARRHRVGAILESASDHSADAAELLLASASQFQKSGDVSRAANLLEKSGAALHKRALAPAAYAAYTRAAALTPASEDFERCIAQAVFTGWEARLAEEVGPLLARFGERLQGSTRLSPAERAEIDVIGIEVQHAKLGDEANGIACRRMIERGLFTAHQALRIAIAGAQAADQDHDSATVAAIAELARGIPLEDSYARHLSRQIAMVRAVSQGQLAVARSLAEEALTTINEDLAPRDRCRPLLNARVPFWFDCDFDRVEQIIDSARLALGAYACTVDGLRTEDIYATHCLDKMRLAEAERVIELGSGQVQAFGYVGLTRNFAELRIRLRIARRDTSIADTVAAAVSGAKAHSTCRRHRMFALCNAAIGLARIRDGGLLAEVVAELTGVWANVARSCPFDYACVALAVGQAALGKRAEAHQLLSTYIQCVRIARHPPSPFVSSLVQEFDLPWLGRRPD